MSEGMGAFYANITRRNDGGAGEYPRYSLIYSERATTPSGAPIDEDSVFGVFSATTVSETNAKFIAGVLSGSLPSDEWTVDLTNLSAGIVVKTDRVTVKPCLVLDPTTEAIAPETLGALMYDTGTDELKYFDGAWQIVSAGGLSSHALDGAYHTATGLTVGWVLSADSPTTFSWKAPTGGGTDDDAIHDNVANEITAITPKTTLGSTDEFVLEDGGASFVKKAVTFGNIESSISLANLGTRTHASLSDAPTSAHHVRYADSEAESVITAELVDGQSIDNAIDALINTHNVANRHIDHSTVSVIAGTGLSGGGTIAATRTINCDITQYTNAMAVAAVEAETTLVLGGVVTIASLSDGKLNLQSLDAGGTPGVPEGGWNYIQFLDMDGDRQGYFGIHSAGHFTFAPEVAGAQVRVGADLYMYAHDIVSVGLVDGVDVSDFKTAYDAHDGGDVETYHTNYYTDTDVEGVITAELVDGQSIDLAIDSLISTHAAIATAHQDAPGLIATHTAIATAHQDAPGLIATHAAITGAHHAQSHSGSDHTGDVIPDANQDFGGYDIINAGEIECDVIQKAGFTTGVNHIRVDGTTDSDHFIRFRGGGSTSVGQAGTCYSMFGANHWFFYVDRGLIAGNYPMKIAFCNTASETPDPDISSTDIITMHASGDVSIDNGDLTAANIITAGNVDGVDVSEEPARITAEIDTDISTHAGLATIHQDAPALISTHALDDNAHHEVIETADVESIITAEIVDGQSIDNAIDALISTHNVANNHLDWTASVGTIHTDNYIEYTDAAVESVITAELVDGQSIDLAIDALISTHNVTNRHIDHSAVSVIAGTGLSGGGTIAATRTINCDITQYTDALVEDVITAELVNGQSIDLAIDALILTHKNITSAHHVRYADSEAVDAVEAADPLALSNSLTVVGNVSADDFTAANGDVKGFMGPSDAWGLYRTTAGYVRVLMDAPFEVYGTAQWFEIAVSGAAALYGPLTIGAAGGTPKLTLNDVSLERTATNTVKFANGDYLGMYLGTTINEFSVDTSLGGDSDNALVTEKAIKAYVDAAAGGPGAGTQWTLPVWATTTTLGDSMVKQNAAGTLLTITNDVTIEKDGNPVLNLHSAVGQDGRIRWRESDGIGGYDQTAMIFYDTSESLFKIATGVTDAITIDTSQNVTITGDLTVTGGDVYSASIRLVATTGYAQMKSAAEQPMYWDAGGMFYWRDIDAAAATRMSLDSTTGNLIVTGTLNTGGLATVGGDLIVVGGDSWGAAFSWKLGVSSGSTVTLYLTDDETDYTASCTGGDGFSCHRITFDDHIQSSSAASKTKIKELNSKDISDSLKGIKAKSWERVYDLGDVRIGVIADELPESIREKKFKDDPDSVSGYDMTALVSMMLTKINYLEDRLEVLEAAS